MRALAIGGELAFGQTCYFVIIECKGKEGELSHSQDTETRSLHGISETPRYPKGIKIQGPSVAPRRRVYHEYQMADVFSQVL